MPHTIHFGLPNTTATIQPFGFMFILDNKKIITQVSTNVTSFLNRPAEDFIDKPVCDLFLEPRRPFFEDKDLKQKTFFEIRFKTVPQRSWLASVFMYKGGYVLEIEPYKSEKVDVTYFENVLDASVSLGSADTLDDIYRAAVNTVQKITGYSKVLFYRYDEINLGEIVAQSGQASAGSGTNLYYDYLYSLPAYQYHNSLIYIPHVVFESSGFFPEMSEEAGHIAAGQLWAPNKAFLKFVKNAGAVGFIGVNIIINKNIWGRVACFSPEAKEVPPYIRQKLTFLGQLISSAIAMKLIERSSYQEATFQVLLARLSEAMSAHSNYVEGLRTGIDSLLRLGRANGVSWRLENKTESFGAVPPAGVVEDIAGYCRKITEDETRTVFHTDSLARDAPAFSDFKDIASGVLFLPLSAQDKTFIMWYRPEAVKYVNRLKNPLDDADDEVVKEISGGYAAPWTKEDVENISGFENTLTHYIIQNSEQLLAINEKLEKLVKERTNILEKENKMRKQAEKIMRKSLAELQRSNAELENFAYVASHDLQEPLRKIQAFSYRLKMLIADKLDEKSEDYFSRLTAAAKRMQKLINDLLSYSRITTHRTPFKAIDLNELFESVLSDLQLKIEEKDAEIKVDRFDREIEGDFYQLQRVFQNLIQNALKFNRKNNRPEIEVKWKANGRKCSITVKDKGIGFDRKYADKIFQLFERLHGRSDYEGTGLGLAICKKIVERHNGKIKTESRPGVGSAFTVELPLKQGLALR